MSNGIECNELGICFGPAEDWIFRHLNLTIKTGQSICLIGPSGSGKSVLLKIIAGLIPPSEGDCRLDRQHTGMLFQKNALFDSLSVEENLLFPMQEKLGWTGRKARDRARQLLKDVQLQGCEKLYPAELSGGMQRRLGIARAWAVEPDILLYDDPSAGLDPITSRDIANLILEMKKIRQSTLVTVTNDVQRALQLGEQIYLLALGQLSPGFSPQEAQQSSHPGLNQFIHGQIKGPLTSDWSL